MSGMVAIKEKWNKIYSEVTDSGDPVAVLRENVNLLPSRGKHWSWLVGWEEMHFGSLSMA